MTNPDDFTTTEAQAARVDYGRALDEDDDRPTRAEVEREERDA